jgi:hypothetical protein
MAYLLEAEIENSLEEMTYGFDEVLTNSAMWVRGEAFFWNKNGKKNFLMNGNLMQTNKQ